MHLLSRLSVEVDKAKATVYRTYEEDETPRLGRATDLRNAVS